MSIPLPSSPDEKNLRRVLDQVIARLPDWDGEHWDHWTPQERTDCVMAMVADMHGARGGGDWQRAAEHSDFLAASFMHDFSRQTGNLRLSMVFAPSDGKEGFRMDCLRPQTHLLPPLPGSQPPPGTVRALARARSIAHSSDDALMLAPLLLDGVIASLGEQLGRPHRMAMVLASAAVLRWKALQEIGGVQGGVFFHNIHDPSRRDIPGGDIRVLFGRLGPMIDKSLMLDEEGGAFILP